MNDDVLSGAVFYPSYQLKLKRGEYYARPPPFAREGLMGVGGVLLRLLARERAGRHRPLELLVDLRNRNVALINERMGRSASNGQRLLSFWWKPDRGRQLRLGKAWYCKDDGLESREDVLRSWDPCATRVGEATLSGFLSTRSTYLSCVRAGSLYSAQGGNDACSGAVARLRQIFTLVFVAFPFSSAA